MGTGFPATGKLWIRVWITNRDPTGHEMAAQSDSLCRRVGERTRSRLVTPSERLTDHPFPSLPRGGHRGSVLHQKARRRTPSISPLERGRALLDARSRSWFTRLSPAPRRGGPTPALCSPRQSPLGRVMTPSNDSKPEPLPVDGSKTSGGGTSQVP